MRKPALTAAALAVAALTTVTGCSSGAGHSDSGSKLLTALGTLGDDVGTDQVTYLDAAAVRKLSKGDAKRFATVGRTGSALLNSYKPGPWGEHLKATQIDTAVDTRTAGRWEGSFDAAAISRSLKSNGYTQSEENGKQTWAHPGSTGMSFQISKDQIAYSADGTPTSVVAPENGSSLADKAEYQRVADCLGDVYRADINPLTSSKPVRLSALGQQAHSAAENNEVLCVLTKDEATAERLAAKLRSVVRDKSPRYDGTKVTVEKGDHPMVRAAVPDTGSQRPGRLLLSDVDLWMAVIALRPTP